MKTTSALAGLISLILAALAVADSVTLRDGSRIEGTILSKSATKLYLVGRDDVHEDVVPIVFISQVDVGPALQSVLDG